MFLLYPFYRLLHSGEKSNILNMIIMIILQ